jgi:signal transduction histidine kinase
MKDLKSFKTEVHLKSTLKDLVLYEASFLEDSPVNDVMNHFIKNPDLPGVIIENSKEILAIISRNDFFYEYSLPFRREIYSQRNMDLFLASYHNKTIVTLQSNMEIVLAVAELLNEHNHPIDSPIIVELDNGRHRVLDGYDLVMANSQINLIAMQALKEANETKTDMLNMAAHDLKNPLNAILGFSKLLMSEDEIEREEYLENVDCIYKSAEHMLKLVMELLNTSVIESGKIQLKKQYIELSDLASAIIYHFKLAASEKNQTINYNYNYEDSCYIFADSLKIRESIENLVSNAIKYSPYHTEILVSLYEEDHYTYLSVVDKGPGISDEDLSKLFGKFQRLTAQPTAGESSTGLGLYIAKQIIELHDGEIIVESKLGEGSKFTVKLPAVDPDSI